MKKSLEYVLRGKTLQDRLLRWVIVLFCLIVVLITTGFMQQASTSGSPGGITNSAGNAVIPASMGTNLITPSGTVSLPATETDFGATGSTTKICGLGSISGSSCFTIPAVAGTSTNPILVSNNIGVPVGSNSAVSYGLSGTPGTGINFANTTAMDFAISGTAMFRANTAGLYLGTNLLTFGGNVGSADISFQREGAGVINLGTGSGGTSARVKASAYMSVGTKFTTNSGCTEDTTVGGGSAGKFTSHTTGACTVIITMGDSATAPNGWACGVSDQTTGNLWRQTAFTTTTASVSGTSVGGDVITFNCSGF